MPPVTYTIQGGTAHFCALNKSYRTTAYGNPSDTEIAYTKTSTDNFTQSIIFTSNGNSYDSIHCICSTTTASDRKMYYVKDSVETLVYNNGVWTDDNYKAITYETQSIREKVYEIITGANNNGVSCGFDFPKGNYKFKKLSDSSAPVSIHTTGFTSNINLYAILDIYNDHLVYYNFPSNNQFTSIQVYDGTTWINDNYKIISFPDNSYINYSGYVDFLTYFEKVTTSRISIDLTTLSGWNSVAGGTHTLQVVAKAEGYKDSEKSTAINFTKASAKVLLEKGTYQFIENPNMNISIDETVSGKMNTLTGNNTYGEQTSFDGISLVDSTAQIGMLFIANSTSGNNVRCEEGDWKYVTNYYDADADEYTATDTTKLRTIALETDQSVSKDFYNWAITQDNLVKVEEPSTGETWVLKSSGMVAPSNIIDETINFTNLIGTAFTRITIESEGKGVGITYYNGSNKTYVTSGESGVTGDNATLIFETAPTGALLTWLQANGTKQGGGTATAHTLTITDQYSYDTAITVNGNTVTSPYTLQNGDVIKVPTLTKTTINGTSYSTFDKSTLNISGEDITVSRSGAEKTIEPVPYITINYTENADSGGSSVSKNWKFNGTAAFMPQMTYSNHVTISGETYNDTTFVEDFKYIYYADDWSCITFGSAGFWDISKNQYGKKGGNILKFNTEPSGELLTFLQAHAQPI